MQKEKLNISNRVRCTCIPLSTKDRENYEMIAFNKSHHTLYNNRHPFLICQPAKRWQRQYNKLDIQKNKAKIHNNWVFYRCKQKYPIDDILKCFCSILLDVLLCSSQNIISLTQGVFFPWNVPDVNGLRIDIERSHIMLINISSTAKVRKDQPAGCNQLCIGPYWNPEIYIHML